MAKKEVNIKKSKSSVDSSSQNNELVEENDNRVFGQWKNPNECAEDIWNSIHSSLLQGDLVFAYKSANFQIVIVNIVPRAIFSVGVVTPGYTFLLPKVGIDYLQKDVIDDLNTYKVDKKIIERYNKIIDKVK